MNRLVWDLSAFTIRGLAKQVQAILNDYPNARLVALSHSTTPDGGCTAVLVLEEPAAGRYSQPPGQLPKPPGS